MKAGLVWLEALSAALAEVPLADLVETFVKVKIQRTSEIPEVPPDLRLGNGPPKGTLEDLGALVRSSIV